MRPGPPLEPGIILEGANPEGEMGLRRRKGDRGILNPDLGPAAQQTKMDQLKGEFCRVAALLLISVK